MSDTRNFTFTPIKVEAEGRSIESDAPRKIIGAKRSIKYRFSSVHISSDKVYNLSSTSSPFSPVPVDKTATIYGGLSLRSRTIEPEIEAPGVNPNSPQCPYSLCIGKAVEREAVLEHLMTAHRVPVVNSSLATVTTSMGGHDHTIQENMKCQWVPLILHCYDTGCLIFLSETKDYYSVWMSLSSGRHSNEGLEVRFDVQSYDARPNSNVKYLTWEGKVSPTLEVDICDTFIIMKDSLLKNFCMSRHGQQKWALDVTVTKRSSPNNSPRSSSGYGSEDLLEDFGSEVSANESLQLDFVDFAPSQPHHMISDYPNNNHMNMESPISIRNLVDASTNTGMEAFGLIEDNEQENEEVAEIMQVDSNQGQAHSSRRTSMADTSSPTLNEEFEDCPCKPWSDDEEDIGNVNDNSNTDIAKQRDNDQNSHNPVQDSNLPIISNSSDSDRLPAFVYFEATKKLLEKFKNRKYKEEQTNMEQEL